MTADIGFAAFTVAVVFLAWVTARLGPRRRPADRPPEAHQPPNPPTGPPAPRGGFCHARPRNARPLPPARPPTGR